MPEIGDQVSILVHQTKRRIKRKKGRVRLWGGYGMTQGLDDIVRYDLDQMPGLEEDAKKIFLQIRVGTLITGILNKDNRYDPITQCCGGWKLKDIIHIVLRDGKQIFPAQDTQKG